MSDVMHGASQKSLS